VKFNLTDNYSGRYNDAEVFFKRVLAVREKILGEEHPFTLNTMKNLANIYGSLERHVDAETLRRRVLTVSENEPWRYARTHRP
jgi:Tetratricopeptide repeat